MSNDYARSTGQPRTVTLDGRDFKVSKLSPAIVGEIEQWLKEAVPNPKAEARKYMEGLPDAVAIQVWRDANEEAKAWPPSMDDDAGRRLLYMTAEGQARLLHAFLRRHAADFTLAAARELAERIDPADVNKVIEASGDAEIGDPKAPAATTATG